MSGFFGRAGLLRQRQHRKSVEASDAFDATRGIVEAVGLGVGCSCGGTHDNLEWPWARVSGPLIFTYQAGHEQLGNALLRAHQVADLLADQSPPFPVYSQSLENLYLAKPRGATIVVTKTGVKTRHLGLLAALKKAGNVLVFDLVDGVVPPELEKFPHAYACSSVTEYEARRMAGLPAFLSLHSPDHRMPRHSFEGKNFGLVYFGMTENAQHLTDIEGLNVLDYEDMPRVRELTPLPQSFAQMAAASHHYSIRQWNSRDGFKPLTKAAVAGAFGACIIAAADEYEASALLGADYPYLAASSEREDVKRVVELAKATYLHDPWHEAVARMRTLTEKTCPIATAHQLVSGIAQLSTAHL